ncbi:MAG: DUF721 domain-containing protein [Simkaniaceae bacterium]|nr:DUF721 domain-containing protein [Simkaniaceae bacterium]
MKRIPKNYSGTKPTARHIQQLIPEVLQSMSSTFKEGGELIMGAWVEVVGEKLAPMTAATSFERGVLRVKVKNATLLSLLREHEKGALLSELKRRFPTLTIKDIVFYIG